jgi:hypothetical protein
MPATGRRLAFGTDRMPVAERTCKAWRTLDQIERSRLPRYLKWVKAAPVAEHPGWIRWRAEARTQVGSTQAKVTGTRPMINAMHTPPVASRGKMSVPCFHRGAASGEVESVFWAPTPFLG